MTNFAVARKMQFQYSSSSSSYVDKNEYPKSYGAVSSSLLLKPDKGVGGTANVDRQPLDKEVILRRIRQCRRVSRFRSVLQSLLKPQQQKEEPVGWLEDAFSAP